MTWVEKLAPDYLRTSPKMTAILGALTGERWTEPRMIRIYITSDRFALGEHEGEVGANYFIGAASDLERNINGVCNAVGLTPTERVEFARTAMKHIEAHGNIDINYAFGIDSIE